MTIAAIKPVFLYSDIVLWVVVACLIFYAFHARKTETLRAAWARVAKQKTALFCAGILALFFAIGLLDSLHYRKAIDTNNGEVVYSVVTESALDALIERRVAPRERSYSAPFAIRAFDKTTQWTGEAYERTFERLSSAREDVTDANFAQKLLGDLAKAVFK